MAIRLDVGCGSTKIDGFIGMDHLSLPGVDLSLIHISEPTRPY